MNLGRAIRVGMAMCDMNQKQLADSIGVHETTISNMIKRESVTTKNLVLIASALGMKASELVKLGE